MAGTPGRWAPATLHTSRRAFIVPAAYGTMPPRTLFLILGLPLLAAACLRTGATARSGDPPAAADTLDLPLSELIDSLHLDAATLRLHVDKSQRRLRVYSGAILVKTYRCVLGSRPEGDKLQQGDRRTPEGIFAIRDKYPHASWHKFIWIDYPNAESWRRFRERKAGGELDTDAGIGGEIGIHGVPEGMDFWIAMGQDWTFGCIALTNADIDEIYPSITIGGTMIEIVP